MSNATWQELNDPWNEWGTWDRSEAEELRFDMDQMNDDLRNEWIEERDDWWREQDAELEREELERIEVQAEAEELRHNGYWD